MAKEFKKWIDEFVENGADPDNVTKWSRQSGGKGPESGSGSNYLMTTLDYLQVVGKHVDVNAVITLFEKHNVNMDEELNPRAVSFVRININNLGHESICFGYDTCRGGAAISIFNRYLENVTEAFTYRNILMANKEKIESFEITKDIIMDKVSSSDMTYNLVINVITDQAPEEYLTIEEALSIFK